MDWSAEMETGNFVNHIYYFSLICFIKWQYQYDFDVLTSINFLW